MTEIDLLAIIPEGYDITSTVDPRQLDEKWIEAIVLKFLHANRATYTGFKNQIKVKVNSNGAAGNGTADIGVKINNSGLS